MLFDLREILNQPGKSLPFLFSLDLSGLELYGEKPVKAPVRCAGQVRNTGGALELTGDADGELETQCARCLKPLVVPLEVPVDTLLAEELENEESEDEIVLLKDGHVDLDEVFTTAFLFAMEPRYLCSEECKGLCDKCGADLNEGPCGCKPELDPRFAPLAKLLDNGPEENGSGK